MVDLLRACLLDDDKLNDRIKIWAVEFSSAALERPDGHERFKITIKFIENANTDILIPIGFP